MKSVRDQIPEDFLGEDPILGAFLKLLDDGYRKLYNELLKMTTFTDYSSLPDSLLDYALFENGLAIYDGYTATQKRDLLDNVVEIDSKRYTKAGLALFIDTLLPNFYVDVEVPVQLNKISFRNPAIGFPNSNMRVTAGREEGDVNPYIVHGENNRLLVIFLFAQDSSDYGDTDFFDFLDTVIPSQLPDMIEGLQYGYKKYFEGSNQVEVNGLDITSGGLVDFQSIFSVGDYIGLYSSSLDEVQAFEIAAFPTSTEITLASSEDTSDIAQTPATVTFYRP